MQPEHPEARALVRLVDEPDEAVYSEIAARIIALGPGILELLEQELDASTDLLVRERIGELLWQIRLAVLRSELAAWIASGGNNLMEAWIAVTGFFYPDMEDEAVLFELASIRKDVWLEMNENLTALELVRVFNQVFYQIHGFSGNIEDYHDPANSMIHKVLQSRKGNPLSLGMIYLHIAQSLDLPVVGINLPSHFVLALKKEQSMNTGQPEYGKDLLFFINPFRQGSLFSHQDLMDYLVKQNIPPDPVYFQACSHMDMILRLLNNLIASLEKSGQAVHAEAMKDLQSLFEEDKED